MWHNVSLVHWRLIIDRPGVAQGPLASIRVWLWWSLLRRFIANGCVILVGDVVTYEAEVLKCYHVITVPRWHATLSVHIRLHWRWLGFQVHCHRPADWTVWHWLTTLWNNAQHTVCYAVCCLWNIVIVSVVLLGRLLRMVSMSSFSNLSEMWYVDRGLWVIHVGMPSDPLQSQGHGGLKVAKVANFKVYLLCQYACQGWWELWHSKTMSGQMLNICPRSSSRDLLT